MKTLLRNFKIIFIFISISSVNSQRFEYLSDDLSENDNCVLSENPQVIGKCKKISDCKEEFEKYRRNESVLKICVLSKAYKNDVICCPQNQIVKSAKLVSLPAELKQSAGRRNKYKDDFLHFESCRNRYLKFRMTKIKCRYCVTVGKPTERKDWQMIAAIGWTQKNRKIDYKCGGAIISERFIVTAAHCRDKGKDPDSVRLGDRYLTTAEDDDEFSQQIKVEKFIPHQEYKGSSVYNDIAVIKTVERIKFSKYVAPACIGDVNDIYIHSAAGYGKTSLADEGSSNVLLKIDVKIVQNKNCSEYYADNNRVDQGILPSQICVKGRNFVNGVYSDTCQGDSGGPIIRKVFYYASKNVKVSSSYDTVEDFYEVDDKLEYTIPVLVGIVSFGIECGLNIPSVNTRVAYYRDWILSTMNEFDSA